MTTPKVIDISHHNTVQSFLNVRKSGILGVIHKATEGTSYVDDTYAERMNPALDADLCWGAYHFLKHGSVPQQMDHFADNCDIPPGGRVAIDYEDTACTLDDLQQALEALGSCDPTWQIAIYSGHLIKDQVGTKSFPWLQPHSLWLAQYTSGTPSWPKQIWPSWSLWQYTDQGSVSGITPPTDLNAWNGSDENLVLWFEPAETPPKPAPEPTPLVVTVGIEVPKGISVTVTINGQPITGE
jgi:lysozyme